METIQLTVGQRAEGFIRAKRETGITGCASATGEAPGKENHEEGDVETRCLSKFENLHERFLTCLLSGNTQGLFESLRELYQIRNRICTITGCGTLPRSRFLEEMQCFALSRGLVFDSKLQRMFRSKLQQN